MIERMAAGISWFDSEIENGLPKNKVTLVKGLSGTGKTNFGLHFIKAGLYNNEHAAFFTAKDSPQLIKEIIDNLGWDFTWAYEQDRFKIVDVRDYLSNVSEGDLETTFLTNFFQEITNIIKVHKIKRLVFDPVVPQSLKNVNNFYFRYLDKLIQFLESSELQVTSLLITSDNLEQKTSLENLATNVIRMFFSRTPESYKRTMFIQKMQNTYYKPKELFFDIIYKEGLVKID